MATYTHLASRGDSAEERLMFVRLYPYSSNEESDVNSITDTIPDGLKDACEQLFTWNAIDYYNISKFEVCNNNYPADKSLDSVGEFR